MAAVRMTYDEVSNNFAAVLEKNPQWRGCSGREGPSSGGFERFS